MLALDQIIRSGDYKIDHLHTVIDEDLRRVGMHGIKEKLIDEQAASLGIPLEKLYLKASDGHHNYEKLMSTYYADLENEDFEGVVFGDIFLEDLRVYREKMLEAAGLQGFYPLWRQNTSQLIAEFIELGYQTKVCAADARFFDAKALGKVVDQKFIDRLPGGVDPCGENGEFHTFVYDGPLFHYPIEVESQEVTEKSYTYKKTNDDGSQETLERKFLFSELSLRRS